ncbi:MAG: hypothetical protein AVDCRST_MAG32-1567 [uncultured Nocardioides sp.]|uniref:Uncharacterized protein n=1 Tax=uncultured Nocardioides sp. TaxID=198441 RepID=A0A6J4N914_9ACTN|nr:MAG: hypothetical protein AVDCRST_MAG32-1567 [uncultured Nocardioides sp.]
MTRAYLPSTLGDLARDWEAAGPAAQGAVRAADESEEAEHEALTAAADVSAARVAGAPDGSRRRVVVVVESGADLSAPRWADVAAVHADADDDTDPDDELGWWATQEVPELLGRG